LQKQEPGFIEANLNDLCASVQHSIVTILIKKLQKAVVQTGVKQVCIAGGVSANSGLRNALVEAGKKYKWEHFCASIRILHRQRRYDCHNGLLSVFSGPVYKFGREP